MNNPDADPRIFAVFNQLPVEQDTLLRIVLMYLSGLPLSQGEALDLLEKILLRAVANERMVCRFDNDDYDDYDKTTTCDVRKYFNPILVK